MLNDFQNQALTRCANDMSMLKMPFGIDVLRPYLLDMADAMQHKTWHAEGDVLTHTFMVVNALDKVLEEHFGAADYVNNEEHQILLLACWFHDFGKPCVKRWHEDKQKNTFYDHERDSMRIWRTLCWEHNMSVELTERVGSIVRFHGEPVHYAKQGATDVTFKKLASQVSPRLVYLMEQADFHGRICDDLESALTCLEQFKQTCERLNVYNNDPVPQILASRCTIDVFRLPSESKTLLLPLAVPGTGKTYLRNKLLENYQMTVISPDDIRVEFYGDAPYDPTKNDEVFGTAFRRLREALDDKHVKWIYFDAQNASKKDRDRMVQLANQKGAETWAAWFAKPLSKILHQNRTRDRFVDEEYITKRVGTLQYPFLGEFDHVVHVVAE